MEVQLTGTAVQTDIDTSAQISFEIGDAAKILHLLTKSLYSKPWQSCVRELVTNALDAHLAAGCPQRPIEVEFTPVVNGRGGLLGIRDYGTGMSPYVIRHVLTKLGMTTKSSDNIQHGGFGIGLLSLFAVASQGTLTTVSEGIEYEYSLYLDATSTPTIVLTQSSLTNKPPQTFVVVPIPKVTDDRDVREALLSLLPFIDPQPICTAFESERQVDCNDRDWFLLEIYYQQLTRLTGTGWNFYLDQLTDLKNPGVITLVRVGQVTYPLPNLYDTRCRLRGRIEGDEERVCGNFNYSSKQLLVIDIPIGVLELPSSRESISATPANLDIIAKAIIAAFKAVKVEIYRYYCLDLDRLSRSGSDGWIEQRANLFKNWHLTHLIEKGQNIPIDHLFGAIPVLQHDWSDRMKQYSKNKKLIKSLGWELLTVYDTHPARICCYVGDRRRMIATIKKQLPTYFEHKIYLIWCETDRELDRIFAENAIFSLMTDIPVIRPLAPKPKSTRSTQSTPFDKWRKTCTGLTRIPSIVKVIEDSRYAVELSDLVEKVTSLPTGDEAYYFTTPEVLSRHGGVTAVFAYGLFAQMLCTDMPLYVLSPKAIAHTSDLYFENWYPIEAAFDRNLTKFFTDRLDLFTSIGCIPGVERDTYIDNCASIWSRSNTSIALHDLLDSLWRAAGASLVLGRQRYDLLGQVVEAVQLLYLAAGYRGTLNFEQLDSQIELFYSQHNTTYRQTSDDDLNITINSICRDLLAILPSLKGLDLFNGSLIYPMQQSLNLLIEDFPRLIAYKRLNLPQG